MGIETWKAQPFKTTGKGVFQAQPFIYTMAIDASPSRTQWGKSRIQRTFDRTQTGVARISKTSSSTIQGKSRIQVRPARTQLGVSAIRKTTSRNILGKSSILKTTTRTTQGKSFIVEQGSSAPSVLNNKVLYYWPFEEVSGDRADVIGDVALHELGAPSFSTVGKVVSGVRFAQDGGALFNAALPFPDKISIAFWFKLDSVSGLNSIVSKDNEFYFLVNEGTLSFIAQYTDSPNGEVIFDNIQSNQWYFVCGTIDSYVMTLRLNDVTRSGGPDEGGGTRNVLAESDFVAGDSSHAMVVDELGIFDDALSESEMSQLYNLGNGTTYPFLTNNIIVSRKQFALSRIQKAQNGAVQGKAAIRNSVTKNEQGKSRIQISSDGSISGHSRIQVKTNQTIGGVARIEKTTKDKSILGVARIQKSVSSSILGKARIQRTREEPQAGYSRIQVYSEANARGLARIRNFVNATSLGLSRIQIVSTKGISGKSAIVFRSLKNVRGRANILNPNSLPVIRVSKDSVRNASNKVGVNNLQSAVNTAETGTSANGSNTETDANLTNSETTVKLTVIT